MRLARRVLSRDEAPSVRLAALARLFAVASNPTHRALDDARATVDVLHALIERVGNQGVHTYAELRSYLPNVTQAQRCKRVLAETLPHRPGVYLFRGPSGEVLYVGTAADLRRRVSQYFNGTDRRKRMTEMVMLASSIDHVECAHPLEAGVRELRMLSTHAPPYNRRSKFPYRWWWVALTDEAFPRLSVIRAPRHDRVVGPFRSRSKAAETAALLARCTGLRTCTTRLTRSARHGPACPELEVSACPAARDVTAAQYAEAVLRAAALIGGLDNAALAAAVQQVTELAERRRYESAARLRDHLATAIEALWHGQRLRALAALPELIAAKPDGPREGGYQLAVIRHGQLAAAGRAPRGVPPMPVVDAIRRGAQAILPTPAPLGGALVEEIALIARWLAEPGVRIVGVSNDAAGLASPVRSAARGQRGRQRRARPSWPASSSAEVGSQICRPNRTHRASNCSAAPVSIAALARRNPSSQAGSHSARLDNPAWATIAPAALSTTASRTGPLAPPNTARTAAALACASPPASWSSWARANPNPAGSNVNLSTLPAATRQIVLVVVVVNSSSPSSPCTTSTLDRRAANTPAITSARSANAHPISPARGRAGLVSGPRRLNTVGTPISRRTAAACR